MNSPFRDRMGKPLTWADANKKIWIRFYNYWLDFKIAILWRFISFIPFHSLRLGLFRLNGIKIGRSSTIHIGARFYQPANIKIGEGSIIGDHVTLDGRASLTIGNHVDIASEVMIYNSKHNIQSEDFEPIDAPVTIQDYVFVGPRAIIMPGVTLGEGAVVAASAVVTRDVSPKTIVAGVPARKIGERNISHFHYRLGRFRLFQ